MVADDVLALKQSSEQGRKGERCNYLLRGIIQPNTHTLNRGEEGGGRDSDKDDGAVERCQNGSVDRRINRHMMGPKGRDLVQNRCLTENRIA